MALRQPIWWLYFAVHGFCLWLLLTGKSPEGNSRMLLKQIQDILVLPCLEKDGEDHFHLRCLDSFSLGVLSRRTRCVTGAFLNTHKLAFLKGNRG